MKKTVVFEVPDDFKFPEHWGAGCFGCLFDVSVDDESYCLLTGDDRYKMEHPNAIIGDIGAAHGDH